MQRSHGYIFQHHYEQTLWPSHNLSWKYCMSICSRSEISMKTTIDVARQTRQFYLQANLLLQNFRHCSDDVKCSLFQTYCTNMYCCQLWFNSTKNSIKSYLQATIVIYVVFFASLNHIVQVICLYQEESHIC